ncbi:MAG TPA: DUF1820 family protein [Solimonas sp.]|nr:DUF1820 family protein [Solimonas sp.]
MASKQRLYRVQFSNHGQVYELYAREVSHGAMPGFLEVGKLVFGERSSIVVDPGEEKLKNEFENVERFYVPVHAVIRVDEVNKQGTARVLGGETGAKIMAFPPNFDGGSRK